MPEVRRTDSASRAGRPIELLLCRLPAVKRVGTQNVSNPVTQATGKKPDPPKKPDFERSLARLEEVVRRLENANLSLDEAMKLFEEGVELSRECQKQLEQAEGRVEILLKKADGQVAAVAFEPESEEEP